MTRPRSGQALVEYVVLLALTSVVGVAAVSLAGPQLSSALGQATAAIADPIELLAAPTATPTPMPAPATPSAPMSDAGQPAPVVTPAMPASATASAPAPTPTPTPRDTRKARATPAPTAAEQNHGQDKGGSPAKPRG